MKDCTAEEILLELKKILADELRRSKPEKDIVNLSSVNPWILQYRNRNHIYVYNPSSASITLNIEEFNPITLAANTWKLFDFLAGSRVTTASATMSQLWVVWTDDLLSTPV